jgi:elongation factor 1-gamma
VHYETNKTPAFTSKFPHGKIPAWDGKDGFKLFEGLAIARYCASPSNQSISGQSAMSEDESIHLFSYPCLNIHVEILKI